MVYVYRGDMQNQRVEDCGRAAFPKVKGRRKACFRPSLSSFFFITIQCIELGG